MDQELAKRMRAARVLADLTQQQLADLLGVGLATIQRREYGSTKITAEQLMGLAQVTGVPLAWLIDGFTDDQTNQPLNEALKRFEARGPRVLPEPPSGPLTD
jgi:transcriptional regulator with XRE-family HTH domain